MVFSRSGFVKSAISAVCVSAMSGHGAVKEGKIKAVLLHLGRNMWCDWSRPGEPTSLRPGAGAPGTKLRVDEKLWRRLVVRMAELGINTLVIDIGEAVRLPSHPELAVQDAWSADKMRSEVRRLRTLGIEAIPKLNFSTGHNGWMGEYRRMISTKQYYSFCDEVIGDAFEIFDYPHYFHIGCDEETYVAQAEWNKCEYTCVRGGELWWNDLIRLVRRVESLGCRAWMWSDYGWDHPEFVVRCPKSVLQSNWYYDDAYEKFDDMAPWGGRRLRFFRELDKAGFDQVPCGTNWVGFKRRELKVGADDVMSSLMMYCRGAISPGRLKGFMMAPWAACDTDKNFVKCMSGIELLDRALQSNYPN